MPPALESCVPWNERVILDGAAEPEKPSRWVMENTELKARISLKNILYATDFSRPSNAAAPYIVSLARKFGSRVFAVHVLSSAPLPDLATQAWQAIAAQALREAKEAMGRLEPVWREIPHEALLPRGDIWTELSRIIEEKRIDLIVTGTHGRKGAGKLLMGSVAERIFRHAPCPVLTVGPNVSAEPESFAEIHTILYPTDFSSESLEAVPYAISLAQEHRARLYLVHVAANPVDAKAETLLKSRLRSIVPPETELWCEPKSFIESGEAAERILALAEELGVDLIVLRPKRVAAFPGATHLAAGTAYKVATQALCPVLSVHGRA
jgi:nucleotide-binding universal stress UspA family protein